MLNGFDSNAQFKALMEQMDIMREDMAAWNALAVKVRISKTEDETVAVSDPRPICFDFSRCSP